MKEKYPRLIISGTQSGVGKTTITLGLLYVLKKRGMDVQPFKVGPDYIDTAFHTEAAGRVCRNLDSYMLPKNVLLELFERQAAKARFSVIEGVMGLFDGAVSDGSAGSTADVAVCINAPIVLVINAGKTAQSAAAMVLGYKMYSPKIKIAACIANYVSGEKHYAIVKKSIESKTGIPVIGYLPEESGISLPERHLGLQPIQESNLNVFRKKLLPLIEKTIDIGALIRIGNKAGKLPDVHKRIFKSPPENIKVPIAVAKDKCFHFYYQDNLDILAHFGAELLPFSPLEDSDLPAKCSGIYIGGGFPEIFAEKLAKNTRIKKLILQLSRNGMPIYGECGGLMYLMKEILTNDGNIYPMAGIFPGKVRMGKRLQSFGYQEINTMNKNILSKPGDKIKGHSFHWSYLSGVPKGIRQVFTMRHKSSVINDGYVSNKTLANYAHIHFAADTRWAENFIQECRDYGREAKL